VVKITSQQSRILNVLGSILNYREVVHANSDTDKVYRLPSHQHPLVPELDQARWEGMESIALFSSNLQ
jgi:hypothetical protein